MVFRFYSANLISCLLTALALALLSVCSRAAAAPWPAGDGVEIGNGFVSEPSGAVVLGDRLWIVSDEGRLWSMGLDGSGPTSTYLGGDLEGVTSANGRWRALGERRALRVSEGPARRKLLGGARWPDLRPNPAA